MSLTAGDAMTSEQFEEWLAQEAAKHAAEQAQLEAAKKASEAAAADEAAALEAALKASLELASQANQRKIAQNAVAGGFFEQNPHNVELLKREHRNMQLELANQQEIIRKQGEMIRILEAKLARAEGNANGNANGNTVVSVSTSPQSTRFTHVNTTHVDTTHLEPVKALAAEAAAKRFEKSQATKIQQVRNRTKW